MTPLLERKLNGPALIVAGALIGLAGVPFIWGLSQESNISGQNIYIGPEIGDASNPFAGKMVSDGKTTWRVDKTDGGKKITVTEIKDEQDKQKWLSEQYDRPPETALVFNEGKTSTPELIGGETKIFTESMDQQARQEFAAQEKMRRMKTPIRYAQAIVPPVLGLGIMGIGIAKCIRRR